MPRACLPRKLVLTAIAAAVLVAPTGSRAQEAPPEPADLSQWSEEQLAERLQQMREGQGGDQCFYAAISAELTGRHEATVEDINRVRLDQASCHATRGEFAQAVALMEQIDRDLPRNRLEHFGLYVSTGARDAPKILKWLRRSIDNGSLPGTSHMLPGGGTQSFQILYVEEMREEADALCGEIVAADWYEQLSLPLHSWCAGRLVWNSLTAGDMAQMRRMLPNLHHPQDYLSMLASREYEAAWPVIEDYAGDHLQVVYDDYVAWTRRRLANDPTNRDQLGLYADALLEAGRDEDADQLAKDWIDGAAADRPLQEGDGWALNIRVKALDFMERTEEADRVFDRLVLETPEQPWMVNFAINRALRLVNQGRWTESLDAMQIARRMAEQYGTDYARLLVANGTVCALHKRGRGEEAEADLAAVLEKSDTWPDMAASALLCAGRRSEATAMLAKAFESDELVRQIANRMQDNRFEALASSKGESDLDDASIRALVMEDDGLRNRMLELVRFLPGNLTPIAVSRRRERLERTDTQS